MIDFYVVKHFAFSYHSFSTRFLPIITKVHLVLARLTYLHRLLLTVTIITKRLIVSENRLVTQANAQAFEKALTTAGFPDIVFSSGHRKWSSASRWI